MSAPKPAFMKLKASKIPSRGRRGMPGIDDDEQETGDLPSQYATAPQPPQHKLRRKPAKARKRTSTDAKNRANQVVGKPGN